jgi:hypothetical protein
MPVIIVLPGIAALVLSPNLSRPDEAYPHLMALLPSGVLGLVFAALLAAIIASLGSKINSIATIFTMDLYRSMRPASSQTHLVRVGRIAAVVALVLAVLSAKPLLGSFDQAFQYIQEFTGFFTPGICVIFLFGMFWSRTTAAGALTAMVGSAGALARVQARVARAAVHGSRRPRVPAVRRNRGGRVAGAAQADHRVERRARGRRLPHEGEFQRGGGGRDGDIDRVVRDLVVRGRLRPRVRSREREGTTAGLA